MKQLDKNNILELPCYEGVGLDEITVVTHKKNADYALEVLSDQNIIGFDTESVPTRYNRNRGTGPTWIQFATENQAFLIQTSFFFGMKTARLVLTNPEILKVGFGLNGDISTLKTYYDIAVDNVEDISLTLMEALNLDSIIGAQAAVAMTLNKQLMKTEQISNWGVSRLSKSQILYAANDAHAAFCVKCAMENEHHIHH